MAVSVADLLAAAAQPRPLDDLSSSDAYPYLARTLEALAALIFDALDLILEITKTHLHHPTLAHAALPSFPPGTTVDEHYVVIGGLPLGTALGHRLFLNKLVVEYEALLHWFASITDLRRHAAIICLIQCLRPNTLFCHHLRGLPPSLTLPTARRLRTAIVTAFARAAALPLEPLLSAPAGEATSSQPLWPPLFGGPGLADPAPLSLAAFLDSVASTLAGLALDPLLRPAVTDTGSWRSSPSPILRDAAAAFTTATSTTSFLDRALRASFDPFQSATVSILLDPHGRPALSQLPHAAGRSLTALFYTTLAADARDRLMPSLSTLARARLNSAATWGATALLAASHIHTGCFLSDAHFTWYLTHLLGLPPPSIPPTRLRLCAKRCPSIKRPILDSDDLAYTVPFAYHHLGCQKTSSRIDRHNHRNAVLHRHIPRTKIYTSEMVKGLFSSATSRKQIDIKFDSPFHAPYALSVDTTISVTLLPTYLRDTAVSAIRPLLSRTQEKHDKHAASCNDAGRAFLAFASDTLNAMGPPAFVNWLRRLYSAADNLARSNGDDGSEQRDALQHLICELQAVLVRDNYLMIDRLTIRDTE